MTTTSNLRSVALAAVVGIVALSVGVLLARVLFPTPASLELKSGTLVTPPKPLPTLDFIDHANRAFDASRLHGRWTLLFFGFTNCPDVCPATLTLLAQAEQQLADLAPAQRPQVVLFSVDPERDTPEQLAKYVGHFSPQVVGVTGEAAAIAQFTQQLGVPVAITRLADGGYTVDHSAAIFLLDPRGELRALFSAPHSLPGLASDYRRIVQEENEHG